MRALSLLPLFALLCGCKVEDRGFGVELTLIVDPSVADGQVGAIRHLVFAVSGDETESTTYDFTRSAFSNREERVVYRPLAQSRTISIVVNATDDAQDVLASGVANDIALASGKSSQATIHLGLPTSNGDMGTGDGGNVSLTLAFDVRSSYALPAAPVGELVTDVNADGKPDVVVATAASAQNVLVFSNDGTGSLSAPAMLTVGSGLTAIAAADFNNDQKQDLVLSGVDGAYVLINKGDGTFKPAVIYGGPKTVIASDVTGDGFPDLVASAMNGVLVLPNKGDGTFMSGATPLGTGAYDGVVAADVNADSKMDIVAWSSGTTTVFLATGGGAFAAGTPYSPPNPSFREVAIGDVTNDGKPDLVFVGDTKFVSVLANVGGGAFSATATTYADSQFGVHLALGDFNGDSKLDVVVMDGAAEVLLNGSGGLAELAAYATDAFASSVAVADLDGDKKLDLVIGDNNAMTLSVIRGRGDGTFAGAAFATTADSFSWATIVDFDGNGKPDVLGGNSGGFDVLLGSGGRSFSLKSQPAIAGAVAYVAADFSGDQKVDVVSANNSSNSISIMTGAGNGTFPSAPVTFSTGTAPTHLVAGDFNADQRVDVATLNMADVSILLNDGSGGFGGPVSTPVGSMLGDIAAGDFDTDGKLDLVVTSANSLIPLRGAGDGTFHAGAAIAIGMTPIQVLVADVDGDKKPDVVVADKGSNDVSVLINDGAGGLKTAVPYAVVSAPLTIVIKDFNRDGQVDIAVANALATDILLGTGGGVFAKAMTLPVGAASINVPTRIDAGDFNGDGLVDLAIGNMVVFNASH